MTDKKKPHTAGTGTASSKTFSECHSTPEYPTPNTQPARLQGNRI